MSKKHKTTRRYRDTGEDISAKHLTFPNRITALPSDLKAPVTHGVDKLGEHYLNARIDPVDDPLFASPQGQLSAQQTNAKLYRQYVNDADAVIAAAEIEVARRQRSN